MRLVATLWRWRTAIAVTAVAIGGCVLVGQRVASDREAKAAHAELHRQIELARKQHLAFSEDEFFPQPPVLDRDNAANVIKQAAALLKPNPTDPSTAVHVGDMALEQVAPAEDRPQTPLSALPGNPASKRVLALAAKAAALGRCDTKPSLTAGRFGAPILTDFANLMDLAVQTARLEAIHGEPSRALDALALFVPLSDEAGQSPSAADALAQTALEEKVEATLVDILAQHGGDPRVVDAAEHCLARLVKLPDLARAVSFENLRAQSLLQAAIDSSDRGAEFSEEPSERRVRRLFDRPGMTDLWQARQYEISRELSAALAAPVTDWRRALHETSILVGTAYQPERDEDAWLISNMMPDWTGITAACARCVTYRRVLKQAIAVLRSPSPLHVLPLGGADATCPFTGEPLKYDLTSKGFRIEAPGRIEGTPENRSTNKGMISFTYHGVRVGRLLILPRSSSFPSGL